MSKNRYHFNSYRTRLERDGQPICICVAPHDPTRALAVHEARRLETSLNCYEDLKDADPLEWRQILGGDVPEETLRRLHQHLLGYPAPSAPAEKSTETKALEERIERLEKVMNLLGDIYKGGSSALDSLIEKLGGSSAP